MFLEEMLPKISRIPKMLKMPKMLKRQRIPTIFEVQTHEFDHEGLFYHNGRGTKRVAGGGPPEGFQLDEEMN